MNYEFLNLGYRKYKDDSEDDEDKMNGYSLSWEELTQLDTEEHDDAVCITNYDLRMKERQRKLEKYYRDHLFERTFCYFGFFVSIYLLIIIYL